MKGAALPRTNPKTIMEATPNLQEIRNNIDAIDDKLVALFEERMALCAEVAAYKKQTAKAVYDNSREKAILARLTENRNAADAGAVKLLYNTIFEISRARQSALLAAGSAKSTALAESLHRALDAHPVPPVSPVVACQGVEGAYSQIACRKLFESPQILYFENFESVFKSVQSGLCRYGVLPFENSIHGSVTEVYDMLSKTDVSVVKAFKLPIHHALLAKKGAALDGITEIYSHRQAIGQCSDFLAAHRKIKVNVCENTAKAAKMVAESERTDIAAISSENCADLYNLSVLKRDLQNSNINFTLFYCISKELEIYPNVSRAAFMFNIPNRAGSLLEVLARFAAAGINLVKIESRPISGKDFEFMFYAEAETAGLDDALTELFAELAGTLDFFKFIGAYTELTPDSAN